MLTHFIPSEKKIDVKLLPLFDKKVDDNKKKELSEGEIAKAFKFY